MIERRIDRTNDRQRGEVCVERTRLKSLDFIGSEQFCQFRTRTRPRICAVWKGTIEDVRISPACKSGKNTLLFKCQCGGLVRLFLKLFEQADCGNIVLEARSRPT